MLCLYKRPHGHLDNLHICKVQQKLFGCYPPFFPYLPRGLQDLLQHLQNSLWAWFMNIIIDVYINYTYLYLVDKSSSGTTKRKSKYAANLKVTLK